MKKSLFFFCLGLSQIFAQTYPNLAKMRWDKAGHQGAIPDFTTVVDISQHGAVLDGSAPSDSAYTAALNALNGKAGVIYFPAGTYLFHQSLQTRDSLILRGAGAAQSILKVDQQGQNGHSVTITGTATTDTFAVANDILWGDSSATFASVAGLSVGDYLKIYQLDTALVTSTWAYNNVGQINQIKAIAGNVVHFVAPFHKDFLVADQSKFIKLNPIREVGIECLAFERLEDCAPVQASVIFYTYAVNCWVSGVSSLKTTFAHIAGNQSAWIDVYGCYFTEGWGYGGDGRAYGIALTDKTTYLRAQNNIFNHLRHSMLCQAGVNGNVFGYNYSLDAFWANSPADAAGDLVLHGNWTYANLFEGNIGQNLIVDDSHGANGPENVFLRNRLENYGIFVTSPTSNGNAFIGNECTNNGFFKGQYLLGGTINQEVGNNIRGTITPANTGNITDNSYYLPAQPIFLYNAGNYQIGPPNALNANTIPAKTHYNSSQLTLCETELGIANENAWVPAFYLYPNPTQDKICFSERIKGEVSLWNLQGEKLASWKDVQNIDISSFPTGTYFLLANESQWQVVKR